MSILIKGIDLPKSGWYLDLVITDDGVVRYYGDEDVQIAEAVELPDHGDLIDRDALPIIIGGRNFGKMFFAELLKNAPVVIPAERTADLCDACGKADKENCSYCEKMERSE